MTTNERSFLCIKCNTMKAATDYEAGPLARSFYICRPCHNRMNVERRRRDPAARILGRVRMQCKRSGVPTTLKLKDFRRLLEAEDRTYVEADMVSCCRIRDSEPLGEGNVKLFRRGRIINAGVGASDSEDAEVERSAGFDEHRQTIELSAV